MAAALPVGAIIKTGWLAFSRAPFLFVGFTLLGGSVNLISQFIQDISSKNIQDGSLPAGAWVFTFILGFCLNVLASLWMNLGLFRGAWRAVGGDVPNFKDFAHWDPKAMYRLFLMTLLIVIVNIIVLAIAALTGGLLSLIRLELIFFPLIAGVLALIYLAVTQMFNLPLVVARGDSPVRAFKEGRNYIDPQFWRMLGFGLLLILITLVGLLLCGIGILVAVPVVVCCLVVAYQHLFDQEDRTGFLANIRQG
jgi:hypothetical protein